MVATPVGLVGAVPALSQAGQVVEDYLSNGSEHYTRTYSYDADARLTAASLHYLNVSYSYDGSEQTDVVPFELSSTAVAMAATGTAVWDTATVTGPTPTGATIQFTAYTQAGAGDECDGNAAYTGSPASLAGPGTYKSASVVLPAGRYDSIRLPAAEKRAISAFLATLGNVLGWISWGFEFDPPVELAMRVITALVDGASAFFACETLNYLCVADIIIAVAGSVLGGLAREFRPEEGAVASELYKLIKFSEFMVAGIGSGKLFAELASFVSSLGAKKKR